MDNMLSKLKRLPKQEVVFLSLLFLLSIYGAIENFRIIKEDTTPFYYDVLDSYVLSERYYNLLSKGQFSRFVYEYIFNYNKDYPPVLIFQPFLFYPIFGVSEDTAAFSNILPLFVILFSTYFLGKRIKNCYVGVLSAIILFFIPGFLPFSRVYLPEFVLASLVTLSLALFLYSDFFENTKLSVLLGFIGGLGMLSKITYPLYVTPFIFIVLIKYVLSRKNKSQAIISKNQIRNILFSSFTFIIIISIWYLKNLFLVIKLYQSSDIYTIQQFDKRYFLDNIYTSAKFWIF